MEQNTLSEYLWIIVILILGIALLIFASPFGDMLHDLLTNSVIDALKESKEEVNIADNYSTSNMINYGD